MAALDIVVVAFLIYQAILILRGRRAAHILSGLFILGVIYVLSMAFGLELIRAVLSGLAPYAPIALIVMFQSEIRRLLARIGRQRWVTLGGRMQKREFSEELVGALTQLSQQRTGALVVVERDIGLRTFIESGVLLDAHLSRDLLLTIFLNGSALHDGAVILQGEKVAAAACFLPLTTKPALARKLGTRHRAAIGVTEETDCLSLIVSEETGRISVAAFGELYSDLTPTQLEAQITAHLIHKKGAPVRRPEFDDAEDARDGRAKDAHAD